MAYIGRSPQYGVFQTQTITPDSSTTNFTLSYPVATPASILVSVGGVIQEPGSAYTISSGGTIISFTEAPDASTNVFLVFMGEKYQVATLSDDYVTSAMIQANAITADKIADGAITVADVANYTITSTKLANSGVTATTYGGTSSIPVVTVDGAGRITVAANATPSIANTQITGLVTSGQIATISNTQVTGVITASQLASTGVTANTYGGATAIPAITVDAQGRITSASNVAATFATTGKAIAMAMVFGG